MATLYVENVPDELYKALKKRARANHTSMAGEVIKLLRQFVPTEAEMKKRRRVIDELEKLRAVPALTAGPFPSAEEMIREDRER
jgi:plasmid stability protein